MKDGRWEMDDKGWIGIGVGVGVGVGMMMEGRIEG
jgi:hypothetical protein